MENNKHRFSPLLMSLCVILGIMVGTFYTRHFSSNRLSIINTNNNKLNHLLQTIDNNYVDTIDINQLVEDAMPVILKELDPHSSYISAKDAETANADLKGSFSGIGVSFTMPHDTVIVNQVIKEGPSEKVGLQFGDRIIAADDSSLIGMKMDEVMNKLRGEKGSKVKLTILRKGSSKPKRFTVVRGNIPVYSIESSYRMNDHIGYLRIKRFAENTYEEFMITLAEMSAEGIDGLIVDLRGNTGGYMHIATQMVNEFLKGKQLILYTEGRKSPREEYFSDGRGTFQNMPITVLIDEVSASASEIFAGAIQDNDRGTVIGRRSFGKGLVQQPMQFKDGSSIRLTIARYYTPSGRCIQKPYVMGKGEDYENDIINRYEHGEFFTADSIKPTGKPFKTSIGRIVYDGGGISPDIFIPQDTSATTSYFKEAVFNGHTRDFVFEYADNEYAKLKEYNAYEELKKYLVKQNLIQRFATYAEKRGLKRRNLMLKKSQLLFEQAIYGGIIYDVLGENEYQRYLNATDSVVLRAQQVLENKESYPTISKAEALKK